MKDSVSADRNKKLIAISKLILLVFIIAGIPAFLYFRFGSGIFSKDTVDAVIAYLKVNRSIAFLLIIGIQMLQVVICILPGQPIQFAASYMYGVFIGFILSLIGAVIGTFISFYLAKLLGSDAMHLFFGEEKIEEYKRRLNSGRGLMIVLLIYLIPGLPKDLVSYAAGLSEMRFKPFLLAATVGRSPAMLGSLLFGHFFGRQNYKAMIILSVVVAVILIICFIKREDLIRILDDIEMNDTEDEEALDG